MRGFLAVVALVLTAGTFGACSVVEGLSSFREGACNGGECDGGTDATALGPQEDGGGGTGDTSLFSHPEDSSEDGGGGTLDTGASVGEDSGPVACDGGTSCGAECCVDRACVAGACTGVCAPGQTQCVGTVVEQCDSSGLWQNQTTCSGATPVCWNGACAECSPGVAQCTTTNGAQTCGASGTWGPVTACSGQTCVVGVCTGVCAPNQTQCVGNGVEECNASGQWGTATACAGVCTAGQCSGTCTPPATQCSGNGVETCDSGGNWGSPVACVSSTCVSGACAGVCAPGQTECLGNVIQSCDASGTWQTQATCSGATPACLNSTCVACSPTTTQCVGNSAQTCSATGSWETPVSCTNQTCISGVCTGSCAPGETQCSGNLIQTCNDGTWQTETTCSGTTPICLNSTCVACSPTTTQCVGNSAQTCSAAGSWETAVPCTNQTCISGACTGSCAPGQTQCSGNTPQSCNASGGWASGTACTSSPCVAGACATPITFVQQGSVLTDSNASSLVLTFPEAQKAGDLIVLAVGWGDATSLVNSVVDTAGNTYARAADLTQSVYYAAGIKAATTNKITVTMNVGANGLDLRAAEFSGLSTTTPLDVTAAASGKTTAASSGNATTTAPYELLFGAGMSTDYYTAVGTGYTALVYTTNGNVAEYEIVSTAGAYSAQATQASASEYVMQLATFQ
jgi:hypothetical protein